jgi:hypothetical protein
VEDDVEDDEEDDGVFPALALFCPWSSVYQPPL